MPDITISVSADRAKGIKWAVDKANAEIAAENVAIQERNANLPEGGTPEVEKPLYTNKTYVEFVMNNAADSYLVSAGRDLVETRAQKLASLTAEQLAQVDAILG